METIQKIYTEKKTYCQYDNNHYLLYLGETIVEDYIPENSIGDAPGSPVTAYSYSGDFPDGGTLIEAVEANYDAFVAGLIRKRYTTDAESAIQSNMIVALSDPENARAIDFKNEWNEFQEYRILCKSQANNLLQ